MNPWLETIGIIILALAGILLGKMVSNSRRSYWKLGYFLSLLLIAGLILVTYSKTLSSAPLFFWIAGGRAKFVILCLAATVGLVSPLSRLPRRGEKVVVCILMTLVVVWFSVLPFLVPALIKDDLSNLKTTVNSSGICYQSTDYTCGPAAAVTALRSLGLNADEGELAVLSYSSPIAGTLPTCLSSALQKRYGTDGLKSQYRYFDSITELRNAGITLAVIKDGLLNSHCVTVLGVTDHIITIADPVVGRILLSPSEFEKVWRFSGIVLKRDST